MRYGGDCNEGLFFKNHYIGKSAGALKQLSVGMASSSYGKAYIHGAGDPEKLWTADHASFLEAMAAAALGIGSREYELVKDV